MQKLTTDSKLFGALRMLDDFVRGRDQGLLDQEGVEEFFKALRAKVRAHQANPALVHGFRAQTMFAYLAAALGGCKIITEEDSGDFYVANPDFKRPDFRILTHSGNEFFVEVKNFHQSDPWEPYVLESDYVRQLQNYARAFQRPLLFAIYWTRWQLWTLNPLGSFSQTAETYSLLLTTAGSTDQKALLGDYTIGIPKPLALRFYTDPGKPRKIDANGHALFTIQRVAFLAAEHEILDEFERRLAWFFLRYGSWEDIEEPAHVVNGEIIYFDIQAVRHDSNPEQRFLMIGQLSEMITRQFNEMTVEDGQVLRLSPQIQPDKFGVVIPDNFTGSILGIWRFTHKPDPSVLDAKTIAPNPEPSCPE